MESTMDRERARKEKTREHIAANASKNSKGWWLPAVWSEDKPLLRAALEEELGRPIPSGYMSEECGWEIPEDYGITDVDK